MGAELSYPGSSVAADADKESLERIAHGVRFYGSGISNDIRMFITGGTVSERVS